MKWVFVAPVSPVSANLELAGVGGNHKGAGGAAALILGQGLKGVFIRARQQQNL